MIIEVANENLAFHLFLFDLIHKLAFFFLKNSELLLLFFFLFADNNMTYQIVVYISFL